jgi:hypothetical protein
MIGAPSFQIEKRQNARYDKVFAYLRGLSYERYVTADGIRLPHFDIGGMPSQSSESLTREGDLNRSTQHFVLEGKDQL